MQAELTIIIGTEEETNALSNELFDFNKNIVPGFVGRDYPSDVVRYVVKQNDTLIAGVVGRITLNHIVYVDDLFVIENFRKQGYATALLDKLESEAKLRGCYLAYLDTINHDAVTFYKKRNYKIFGILDNVPCPGVKAVYLKKDL
ncbi:MAG: GNAT family N-acetyltransferase [Alphaproteobacteria bacterium]|nr:GNAT family N-acetyltransferase [Alphaproteobacteria bacterium]